MNDLYALLNAFINTHEATTTETKDRKDRIMKNVKQLYNKYFNTYKKNYDSEKVKKEKKGGRDYKKFEKIDNGDQEPKSTQKEETETKKPDEIQKPLWVKLNENDFDSLIQDVYNNLNNDEFKTTVDKKAYDMKNAKKFLVKIITQKIGGKDAFKLYSDLITPDITALEKSKSKGKHRRNNILNVLKNLESVLTSVYLNYSDKPSESEESIAEGTKLRRQISDKIGERENMIDLELFRNTLSIQAQVTRTII